jgi:hypothetical protein
VGVSAPPYYEALQVEVCLATGARSLVGDPPPAVAWSVVLVDMLRANPGEWATVAVNDAGHEVITLNVQPEPVAYVLTGPGDFPDEIVGELVR